MPSAANAFVALPSMHCNVMTPACTAMIVSLQAEKAKSQALETACSKAQSEAKHSAMHLAQVIRHTEGTKQNKYCVIRAHMHDLVCEL